MNKIQSVSQRSRQYIDSVFYPTVLITLFEMNKIQSVCLSSHYLR